MLDQQLSGRGIEVPVFLWAGDTWCLAAGQDARRFFARLLPELPSVRHAFQTDAPLLRLRQGPASSANSLDRFFVAELRELREQFDQRAMPVVADLFGQLLATTLADLPDAAPTEPATQLSDTHRRVIGQAVAALLPVPGTHGQQDIGVHAPAVLKHMSEYLLGDANTPVVVVTSRFPAQPGTELELDTSKIMLPLRGDIWAELEPAGNAVRVKKTAHKTSGRKDLGRCKIQELTLQLVGLGAWRINQPFGDRPLRLV